MGISPTDREWRASATCPQNGPVSARCLVFPRGSRHIRVRSSPNNDLHRGNGILPPRDRPPKIAVRPETVSAETETPVQEPANCGLLGRLREISRFERVRGGPGRTTSFPQNQPLNRECDNQKPRRSLGSPRGVSHFLQPCGRGRSALRDHRRPSATRGGGGHQLPD
jgi:hypothetical protein